MKCQVIVFIQDLFAFGVGLEYCSQLHDNLIEAPRHMKTLKTWAAAAAIVALTGSAQAALIDRGGGMIYDTTRNLTWLANMNTNGLMTWAAATTWANNLVHGGFDDWRLPTLNPADTTCSLILTPPRLPDSVCRNGLHRR